MKELCRKVNIDLLKQCPAFFLSFFLLSICNYETGNRRIEDHVAECLLLKMNTLNGHRQAGKHLSPPRASLQVLIGWLKIFGSLGYSHYDWVDIGDRVHQEPNANKVTHPSIVPVLGGYVVLAYGVIQLFAHVLQFLHISLHNESHVAFVNLRWITDITKINICNFGFSLFSYGY